MLRAVEFDRHVLLGGFLDVLPEPWVPRRRNRSRSALGSGRTMRTGIVPAVSIHLPQLAPGHGMRGEDLGRVGQAGVRDVTAPLGADCRPVRAHCQKAQCS